MSCRHVLLAAVALMAVATREGRAGFADVSVASGIDYVHAIESQVPLNPAENNARPTRTMQSNYAGAAAVDVDGDGWTDLLAARHVLPPVLYINNRDGTFREEAVARGLGSAVNAGAFGAGDFDNDGDQDILIVPAKGSRYWLFINDGTGRFREEAIARGAAVSTTLHDHEAYSVGLVDYDRDGFLDIYVSEWGIPSSAENHLHSVLLRNVGASAPGTFVNVTAAAGLTQPAPGATHHYGFASAWADFDGDGWPDLALVGDFGASRMYWNNGNGTFTESEHASGVGLDEFGMGVAVADYDRDGRLDFYVTSIYDRFYNERAGTHTGNKLYRNLGNRRFEEVARPVGVDRTDWGWGAAFFEFDNDGDPDLIVTNGMDAAELGPTGPFY
ncbi:MAG TPA: VCBS repeat-containing protein, partial [Candidatus Synoicihabitans sp.]|nr:VCBS repeat-containing protein [Candidatus Synoicihabitans sp.]